MATARTSETVFVTFLVSYKGDTKKNNLPTVNDLRVLFAANIALTGQ